jgi:uncharacterized membrane protein YbhN (UPF0104 family)
MRKLLLLAAKISISAILMFLALRKVNFTDLGSRLDLECFGWLAVAVTISLAQVAFGALRWRIITSDCGAPLNNSQVLRFNMIGTFFNQTLPSSIGGDAVRIWLVRRTGSGWRRAGYSVVIDRAIGLIALSIVVVCTLPWSYQLIGDPHGRYALLFVDFAALAGGTVFLLVGRLPWAWLRTRWQTKDIVACSITADRLLFGSARGPAIVALSLLIHLLSATVVWCVARSIEAPVSFFQVFQLIPPVILITMIPISIAGWGVREATMGLAFGYAGLMASEGVNVSLLYGAVTFSVGALGGLVWVMGPEKSAPDVPAVI